MTTTTTHQPRRPIRHPLHGSAFGNDPLPTTGHSTFDAATAEGARRQKLLLDAQDALVALRAERDAYRADRDGVLADIVRGIAKEDEMLPDREQEFLVAESDLERRIEIASKACQEQDETVMTVAVERAAELAEAAEATTAPLRAKARKTASQLQTQLDALRKAESVQRWLSQLSQDDLQLYRPPTSDTTLSSLRLDDPVDPRTLLERAHDVVSEVGAQNILYGMEVASAPGNRGKLHPAYVATEYSVPLDALRRALHERRMGLYAEERAAREADLQRERDEVSRARREDWVGTR
jgi:hypothetical protein